MLDIARKILLLEQTEGFGDKAVVGGLQEFLDQVRRQALPELSGQEQQRLGGILELLDGYGTAAIGERKAMLETGLQLIVDLRAQTAAGSAPSASKPTSQRRVRPTGSAVVSPESGAHSMPKAPRPGRQLGAGASPAARGARLTGSTVTVADLDGPIERLPGIGATLLDRLHKLDIHTPRDALLAYPLRHLDRSSFTPIGGLQPGQLETVMGTVVQVHTQRRGPRMATTTAMVADDSGQIMATWFNQPYLQRTFASQPRVVLSGKVELFRLQRQFSSPDWELVTDDDLLHTGRLVPVYRLTEGLRPKALRTLMKRCVDTFAQLLVEFLPGEVRRAANLMNLAEATAQYHFPDTWDTRLAAERRLAFDELFLIQLTVLQRRREWQREPGPRFKLEDTRVQDLLGRLPFTLTEAQRRALDDVLADVRSGRPMNRLIEGDVGSGKTVVAALAMQAAVSSGFQAVLMAPTEILAEQHYHSITALLDRLNGDAFHAPVVRLLTGAVKGRARADTLRALKDGSASIAVGTQALIQQGVELEHLGLAVVDEQHRFGVDQRKGLRQKGFNPHVLVLTATPIPRTLGLTIYGDLDISVIDEMPPGRLPVKTRWFNPEERGRAYDFIRRQVEQGRQAFIIYPLVDESERMEARAATAEYERLRQRIFPTLRLGLLHGRMKSREKEEVMAAFAANQTQVLVSTSVVEVGIDVPNATVVAIEGAERFGLSQLHQFRGRVGRGSEQSYCILLSDAPGAATNPRLKAIEETQSGFRLAQVDLELRGYGDLFGTRQSGLPNLRVAKLTDTELIETSRRLANALLDGDPTLAEQPGLRGRMEQLWHQDSELS
ncbi:MAG: ATP-dependent DNA helicase RecG [Chloroflexota bacterium]